MSNYTQLQDDIAAWFARNDLPAATFISLAESEMNRVLRVQGMEQMTSATPLNTTDNGLGYLTFPPDYMALKHIESAGQRLEFLTNNQMNTDAEGGYTIANDLFLFAGLPPVDIYYFARIPALSDTNPTNLFTMIGYDALLYLSLDHTASYMGQQGDYRQRGIELMQEIQNQDYQAAHSGAPLVMRG